jgi:hypothetical protein
MEQRTIFGREWINTKVALLAASAIIVMPLPVLAVEYQGKSLDGQEFEAQAFSYNLGGVYPVRVNFKGDKAILRFAGGDRLTIRLDNELITDPKNIQGFASCSPFSIDLYMPDVTDSRPPWSVGGRRSLTGQWRIFIDSLDSTAPTEPNQQSSGQGVK